MRSRICLMSLLAVMVSAGQALAQNWSFDARAIALGGVGGNSNLAGKMIAEQRDYTSMQGVFLIITISVVVSNLLADLLYGRLDPRVRVDRSG